MARKQPRAGFVEMTPLMAAKLLEGHNSHNRVMVESRVEQYAEDIRRGNWLITGEAIKIDWNGVLLDGQHRLMAVCEANRPAVMLVVKDLDPRAQEAMDQGLPRGFHDVLRLRGEPNPYELAAATKAIATYERDGLPFARGYAAKISNQVASDTLGRRPDIREAVQQAIKWRKRWIPASATAALYYLCRQADPTLAHAYYEQLSRGTSPGAPVHLVRERLIGEELDPAAPRAHAKIRMVYVIIGWNATWGGWGLRDDELRWSFSDPFPGIAGLERELADAA